MHLLEEDVVGTVSLIPGRRTHRPKTDGQTDDLLTVYRLNVPELLTFVTENKTLLISEGINWINFKVLQNIFLKKTIFTLADVLLGVRGLPCDTGDSRSCAGPV